VSGSDLIADLVGPSLAAEEDRSELLAVYGTRILALGREPGYRYLYGERERFLVRLAEPRERLAFLLAGWLAAERAQWRDWSELLGEAGAIEKQTSGLCAALAAKVLTAAASQRDAAAIETDAGLLELLAPGLAELDEDEVEAVAGGAKSALEGAWWSSALEADLQAARHALIRHVEALAPAARSALASERDNDALWPLEEEDSVGADVVRGWRQMALGLGEETYERLYEALPQVNSEEHPLFFAERTVAAIVLHCEGGYGRGRASTQPFVDELKTVRDLGAEYRPQLVAGATAALELRPSANQVTWLIFFIDQESSESAKQNVREWSGEAGRGPSATLIRELMPLAVGPQWMEVLRECEFDWAPVRKKVEAVLLSEDNAVADRLTFARCLGRLGTRTRAGPEQVARMIATLLNPKRKKHRRNDLSVALALCEALIGAEREFPAIEKALIAYSKRHKCRYTPDQNRLILMAGIVLPKERLSPNASSGLAGAIEEVREFAAGLGRAVSALNPFSGGED
jgi:hypothetical protein